MTICEPSAVVTFHLLAQDASHRPIGATRRKVGTVRVVRICRDMTFPKPMLEQHPAGLL